VLRARWWLTLTALLSLALPALPDHAAAATSTLRVKVMTYNLLEATRDGTRAPSGLTIAPWSHRRDAMVPLIRDAAPDVIAVQEGASWVAGVKGPRQVDDLVKALGGTYALARTEIPPTEPHYFRTGRYIVYKTSAYRPVGQGGHWDVGDESWTAYQVLENRATGDRFLFVATHLLVGRGRTYDQRREAETQALIKKARSYAAGWHVPVVYAGDFNSHGGPNVSLDGPRVAMHAARIRDAYDIAASRYRARYDSANLYQRRPPAYRENVDHLYVPRGISVRSWGELLHLSNGKFAGTIPSDHNPVVATLVIHY
jgi:endonuclease/exonuclease/phosphatase family metal-dependent hydrolase